MVARTRLKVCCIQSVDEVRVAVRHGADAVGLVGAMPSGPGPIDDAAIAEIAAAVPPPVAAVLLTAETDATAIADHVMRTRPTVVQVVSHVEPAVLARLKRVIPSTRLLQVVHVEDASSIERARAYAIHADALLLDSGRPSAAVAELGGTGRTHDWTLSRRIVDAVDRPVFLAGGIRPDNVAEAIAAVRPFGIDLCSGIREGLRLDPVRLAALTAAMAAADHGRLG
jgi:phosphoribosylanthranilate isomerase